MMVLYKSNIIIISSKVYYSRHDIAEKIAHLALNNNHSLTYIMTRMTMLESKLFSSWNSWKKCSLGIKQQSLTHVYNGTNDNVRRGLQQICWCCNEL